MGSLSLFLQRKFILFLGLLSFVLIFSLLQDALGVILSYNNLPKRIQRDDTSWRTSSPQSLSNGEGPTLDFAVLLKPSGSNDEDSVVSLEEVMHISTSLDMQYISPVGSLLNYHIFRVVDEQQLEKATVALENHPRVMWFSRQTLRRRYPRNNVELGGDKDVVTTKTTATIPSDEITPLLASSLSQKALRERYPRNNVELEGDNITATAKTDTTPIPFSPPDPLFPEQWHLHNTGQRGGIPKEDMRVLDAWTLSRGRGVCVAIVDDGLMYLHPDLAHRYSAANSHNFNADGAPTDPMPIPGDSHGTMCAGATAASTNDVCGIGVAFESSVSGLRILGGPSSDAMEAQALTYMYNDNHIYSSSWGPTDNGLTLEGPGPLTRAALVDGVKRGRGGKGAIYVWAAGNGARFGDNCNYDGYASSRYVLTVGAVNHFGIHAYYSEPCAAIIVSAPSSGQDLVGITTTNMNNDCTNDFTGTSASAPLVAGVVALILEVNENLTWRDVHHIMARTARQNDKQHSDWLKNGRGLLVNHKYGFGVVDAYNAVLTARSWKSVGPEVLFSSPVIDVHSPILDNNPHQPVISSFRVEKDIILEHVEVIFTAFHPFRSDLRVVLRSPAGTPSVLSSLHGTSSSYEFQVKGIAKSIQIVQASFGPSPAEWALQNATTLLAMANPLNACIPLENTDLTGLIVIVQRGSCDFIIKVKHAQDKNAAAVVVVPDNAKGAPMEMNGMDSSIVIPSVMTSGEAGNLLLSKLKEHVPVVGTLLARVHKQAGLIPFNDWTFSTVRNWDESSVGDWSLEVSDLSAGGVGTFDRWQLKLHGTQGNLTPEELPHKTPLHPFSSAEVPFFGIVILVLSFVGIALAYWVVKYYENNSVELEEIHSPPKNSDVGL